MHQLIIEPRDSLLFRDAREFASEAGSASSLAFPLPSVLAGAIRTRLGSKGGEFDGSQIDALLATPVLSPFLVSLTDESKVRDWYFPAPADAVVFEDYRVKPLYPFDWPVAAKSDFADFGLKPLSFDQEDRSKPMSAAPKFWSYKGHLEGWLMGSKPFKQNPGIVGPIRESRVHVQVGVTGTAADRALFATEMLRFTHSEPGQGLNQSQRLGIVSFVDRKELSLNGFFPLGGERRLAHWRSSPGSPPACPDGVRKEILKHRQARLLLLTPGYFQSGVWRPQDFGPGVELQAAALRGPTTASGWDLAKRQPKPSRRLATAGTTYFVTLPKQMSEAEVNHWIDQRWFKSLGDDEQSRRDGFGVALVGAWTQSIESFEKRS